MSRHAFTPSLRHDDYCAHCGNAREAAVHDVFSSSDAHPGLARLNVSDRLAALLGCTRDELRASLATLLAAPLHAGSMREGDHVHDAEGNVFRLATAATKRCTATVDDDCKCERSPGHRGLHTHINTAWDHGMSLQSVRLRWRRCAAACSDPDKSVLPTNHEGAHELDNGETFR